MSAMWRENRLIAQGHSPDRCRANGSVSALAHSDESCGHWAARTSPSQSAPARRRFRAALLPRPTSIVACDKLERSPDADAGGVVDLRRSASVRTNRRSSSVVPGNPPYGRLPLRVRQSDSFAIVAHPPPKSPALPRSPCSLPARVPHAVFGCGIQRRLENGPLTVPG